MVSTLLLMGLAALVGTAHESSDRDDEGSFVELFSTPLVGDPAEEVLYVFADPGARGDELYVLSHRKTLGVFRVDEEGRAEALESSKLPDVLEPGKTWVSSKGSIGTAAFEEGSTVYHRFFPEEPEATRDVTRVGNWGVLASDDGTTLFFVRGGTEVEQPAEYAVMVGNEERLLKDTRVLPRIRSSQNGDQFVVQAETNTFHQPRGNPIPLPPGGTLYLQPEAQWLVHELRERIELRKLTGDRVVTTAPTIAPPLMAVEFEGPYVLLVGRTHAALFDLRSIAESQAPLFGVDATEGHRFSSAALFGRERTPWVALGELSVLVPQMALPNAAEPRASAIVRVVEDSDQAPAEAWSIEVAAWRANTPLVQWSKEGRLLASTKDRVLVSTRRFR